jgi:hypothetical protein
MKAIQDVGQFVAEKLQPVAGISGHFDENI